MRRIYQYEFIGRYLSGNANALDRLQNGQSIEEIIAAYPEYAARLKGILQTANVSAASVNIVILAAAMAAS